LKQNSQVIALRIDSETLAKLRQEANEQERTLAKQVAYLLKTYYKEKEAKE
jgi:hypothetical protein